MALQHSLEIKGNGLNALANVLHDMPSKLPKEIASVANKVAKEHSKSIARTITGSATSNTKLKNPINMKQKDAQKMIALTKFASASSPQAKVEIKKGWRPSLKLFGLKQLKRGISYKVSKKKGTIRILAPKRKRGVGVPLAFKPTPFVSQALGGHAYARLGRKRTPIDKLQGPSVWGVYVNNNLLAWSQDELGDELGKQIERRIRAIKVSAIKRQGRAEGLSTDQINQRLKEQL